MRPVLAMVVLIALVILSGSVYILPEWQQAIITQFGEPVGDPVVEPGLKFKLPLIQKVHRLERRFLEWEGEVAELPTKDKVFILVDTFARWKISDPLLFYQRNPGGESGAQSRLDDILNSATRSALAKHELVEVIRTSNREAAVDEANLDVEVVLEEILIGRENIRLEILAAARDLESQADLGIEILDVQFKRINYGQQVLDDVYNRMISERVRISDRFRSEGQGEKAEILGNMERELQRIRSEAYRTAEEIRGRADAEATQIYARAYDQSQQSREFYEFLKSLETLESTADDKTSLVLSTDGELYRFLKQSGR